MKKVNFLFLIFVLFFTSAVPMSPFCNYSVGNPILGSKKFRQEILDQINNGEKIDYVGRWCKILNCLKKNIENVFKDDDIRACYIRMLSNAPVKALPLLVDFFEEIYEEVNERS